MGKLPAQIQIVNSTRANIRRSSQIPLILLGAGLGLAFVLVAMIGGLIR
jgi:hypothetical protein